MAFLKLSFISKKTLSALEPLYGIFENNSPWRLLGKKCEEIRNFATDAVFSLFRETAS